MIHIGEYNLLIIDRHTSVGMYLVDEENTQDVLLPNRYVNDEMREGEYLEVFVYNDSEDRIVATTEEPAFTVGEFAFLQVVAENRIGAFLDWGLQKDLLVPFAEMDIPMKQGKHYPVLLQLDYTSKRLFASSKLYKYLKEATEEDFSQNKQVDIFLYEETTLGFKAIIEKTYRGMIYHNEIFQKVKVGDTLKAFVKTLREDGKVDLSLQKIGFTAVVDPISQRILNDLEKADGFLPYHDKSAPEEIKAAFKLSKKIFKKAIGKLYKEKRIDIEKEGIRLLEFIPKQPILREKETTTEEEPKEELD